MDIASNKDVDLDAAQDWAQFIVSRESGEPKSKTVGEPGRTRTCNPLIKSQLLYHWATGPQRVSRILHSRREFVDALRDAKNL